MQSITLGDVTVTRITEWEGTAPITAQLAPEGGREVWERHGSWLAPNFWNRESNEVVTWSASYLIRSAGSWSTRFAFGNRRGTKISTMTCLPSMATLRCYHQEARAVPASYRRYTHRHPPLVRWWIISSCWEPQVLR